MSTHRYAQFLSNVQRARDQVALGRAIGGLTVGIVDATDLYRFGLVQSVSGLDTYIHGIVLDKAVDILLNRVSGVTSTLRSGLSFGAVQKIIAARTPSDQEIAARTHLAQMLSKITFQLPDDIAKGLAAAGIPKIWSTAFGTGAEAAKTELGVVIDRRNRIVHSCDADPLTPGSLTTLSDRDALDAISTIERTVAKIDPFC